MKNRWRIGIRTHWPKLALVFVVFTLMVWVSYAYVSAVVREQMHTTANQHLMTVEANIRTSMRGPEAVLVAATVSLRQRLNGDRAAMRAYMESFTRWLRADEEHVTGFLALYGLIDGKDMDGAGRKPPPDYVPEERPWYRVGKAGKGMIGVTAPYVDATTREVIVTYSQELFDDTDESRGVVSIDVLLKRVAAYVTSARLVEDGHSMLLSRSGTILAHSDARRIGQSLHDLSPGFARIADGLPDADEMSEWSVEGPDGGEDSVAFVKRLYNGWYVCMVAPEDAYYAKVWSMAKMLALAGLLFAVILSVILLRLSLAQISADEASRIKSLFLARMSHDIRTPMNAIIGISELVLRESVSQTVRAYVADVKQAGLNLLSLINDILDFSRIESGKMELNEAEYDLSSLIHDIVTLIKMRIAEAPLNFSIFVDSALPATLIGDKARIRQILLNLLANAVKYTPKGEVSLGIRGRETGPALPDGSREIEILCEIQDCGIGIRQEDIGKLFTDFTRLDASANTNVEGTGLGLAIARNLALMMGGDVTVRSEYGKGSVFTAQFRQKCKTDVRFARVENAAEKTVLLYEPRRKAAEWILMTLENLGVFARRASTREEFERALDERRYDFVFSWRFLTDSVVQTLAARGLDTIPVALDVKPSETVPPGARALMLPAYALLVANVLNGKTDERLAAATVMDTGARFTLPDVRVLIVDDIDVNLRVSKGLLSCYKMQVDCALSGAESIRLAQKKHYDIIFMDHMMPQMDGVEATARLRALGGEFETLPIVALTANAVSGMREMFLASGFSDFLSKPIEVSKLNAILERWIPKSRRVIPAAKDQPWADPPPALDIADIPPIAGVDMALGLTHIGGKTKDYLEILAAFVRNVEERLEILDPGADIKTFTIHVHALKSAAANIGALAVSKEAAALEAAGTVGDRETILKRWGNFTTALKTLNADILAALQRSDAAQEEDAAPPQTAPEAYEILARLKAAIRAMEIDGIDAALEHLQRIPLDPHWREQTAALTNMALLARFDEALAAIDALEAGRKRL